MAAVRRSGAAKLLEQRPKAHFGSDTLCTIAGNGRDELNNTRELTIVAPINRHFRDQLAELGTQSR